MGIYIFLFSITILLASIFFKYKKSKWIFTCFVFLLILIIFLQTFRDTSIGIDTVSYMRRFINLKDLPMSQVFRIDQELGFSLLIKFAHLFGSNFTFFLFFVSCLTFIPIFYTVWRYSPNPFLSILLLIAFDHFAFTFSGLRQGIALGFIIYSFKFIDERKPLKYVIVLIFSSLFHISAILFLPVYILNIKFANKIQPILFFILLMIFYLFRYQIYNFGENLFFSTEDNYYGITETGAYTWFIMVLLISSILLIKSIYLSSNQRFQITSKIVMVGAILLVFSSIGTNAKRLAEYFSIFYIFAIPMMVYSFKNRTYRYIVYSVVIIFSIIIFGILMLRDQYEIIPYLNIFV